MSASRRGGAFRLAVACLAVVCGLAVLAPWRRPSSAIASVSAPLPLAVPPLPPPPRGTFARTLDLGSFQRGNLHTHTTFSDGDARPEAVIQWYRAHGYQFLAITDHNTFTPPANYRHLERPDFLLLGGEELTMRGANKQVHVNGLCTTRKLGGGLFPAVAGALNAGVRRIHGLGGVALINHPNWRWAVGPDELLKAPGAELIEIASGHPLVATQGDETHPSHEALWDVALEHGWNVMGVAVDDAHQLEALKKNAALPGQAWVEVAAPLQRDALCEALRQGHLYASTGVRLARILVEPRRYTIWPASAPGRLLFIGAGGRILAEHALAQEGPFSYEPTGEERYVRARVESDGHAAWTPAIQVLPAASP